MEALPSDGITGRCYCGAITFQTTEKPLTVAYCHCDDCRRATGGPVAAFAAFREKDIVFAPHEGKSVSLTGGVVRTFCETCGSSLTGRYDYLPDQVFISIGVIDQAEELPPQMHTHEDARFSWLHIEDGLERAQRSGRAALMSRTKETPDA